MCPVWFQLLPFQVMPPAHDPILLSCGSLIIDDIQWEDGWRQTNVLGGAGVYAIYGRWLWMGDKLCSTSTLSIVMHRGARVASSTSVAADRLHCSTRVWFCAWYPAWARSTLHIAAQPRPPWPAHPARPEHVQRGRSPVMWKPKPPWNWLCWPYSLTWFCKKKKETLNISIQSFASSRVIFLQNGYCPLKSYISSAPRLERMKSWTNGTLFKQSMLINSTCLPKIYPTLCSCGNLFPGIAFQR